jgi:peptidoglycan hydrolase-like amidase
MIHQQLRRLTVAVLVTLVALGSSPAAADEAEPTITFFGGGLGHGIGMSQYGALGRAEAGHTYDEILAFYYANTELESVGDFGVDAVDVLLDRRSKVAVSRPWVGGAPQEGWEVEITADGGFSATADDPVTAMHAGGVWSATVQQREEDGTIVLDEFGSPVLIELCNASCTGELAFRVTGLGTHAVVEQSEGGANVGVTHAGTVPGAYAGGQIVLHPASLGGGCGGGNDFCVLHGGVELEQYVRGIAEIPTSWPVEAQKAQAVAARSFAASAIIRRAGNDNAWDVENSTNDQYYAGYAVELNGCGNWCTGVNATAGEVLVHDSIIAETYYSASNGGHTAEPPDVWSGGTTRPYLLATLDPFDHNDANPYAAKDYVYSVSDVSDWLNEYHIEYPEAEDQLQVGTIRRIDIDAPPSGRVSFATVTLVGTDKTSVIYRDPDGDPAEPYGFRLYNALKQGCERTTGCDALRSTNFTVLEINPFSDVGFNDYFFLPVKWMTAEGLTTGVSPTVFGSNDPNTRAQLATFIWRFAGKPAPGAPHGFVDVVEDSFYEDAVAWMKEAKITTGTSPTEFSPDGTVSRAQAAAFLWRLAGSPEPSATLAFTDVADDTYYTDAVRWMVEWDITTGTSPTTYSPDDLLTRAQIATFLWRLAGKPDAFAAGVELPPAMRDTE